MSTQTSYALDVHPNARTQLATLSAERREQVQATLSQLAQLSATQPLVSEPWWRAGAHAVLMRVDIEGVSILFRVETASRTLVVRDVVVRY